MIVTPLDSGDLLFVTQTDHAKLSAELLSLWTRDLPEFPWRKDLLEATREHDNGWAEIDSAPLVDKDGKPHDFRTIPGEIRRDLWTTGTRRHVETNPLVALWIVRHALYLHQSSRNRPDWKPIFDSWVELEESLLAAGPWTADEIDAGYRLLNLADAVSLLACTLGRDTGEAHGYRFRVEVIPENSSQLSTVFIDPFPLAGSTTFKILCRWISRRRFDSDSDLAFELASARWRRLEVRICAEETPTP